MGREIEFRALAADSVDEDMLNTWEVERDGRWIYGTYFSGYILNGQGEGDDDYFTVQGSWCPVKPETVGRFSGWHDKNHTKVFEGDIISLITADGDDITVICKFGMVRRQIYENLVEINGFYFERSNDGRKTFPIVNNYLGKHDTEIWEVVGNIHEQQTGGRENG